MYKVYQDGKPADISGYPELDRSWNPDVNTHLSLKEAEKYALRYAYPYTSATVDSLMEQGNYPKMEINVPINMSMGETPVMMEIRKIEDVPDHPSYPEYKLLEEESHIYNGQ